VTPEQSGELFSGAYLRRSKKTIAELIDSLRHGHAYDFHEDANAILLIANYEGEDAADLIESAQAEIARLTAALTEARAKLNAFHAGQNEACVIIDIALKEMREAIAGAAAYLPGHTLTDELSEAELRNAAEAAATIAQRRVEELEEALQYIAQQIGKDADGFIDWQRCVDRIQEIARAALSHRTGGERLP
jgi:epoxyqueuosine reductase QueG